MRKVWGAFALAATLLITPIPAPPKEETTSLYHWTRCSLNDLITTEAVYADIRNAYDTEWRQFDIGNVPPVPEGVLEVHVSYEFPPALVSVDEVKRRIASFFNKQNIVVVEDATPDTVRVSFLDDKQFFETVKAEESPELPLFSAQRDTDRIHRLLGYASVKRAIAYMNSDKLSVQSPTVIAYAITHEILHMLGLRHSTKQFMYFNPETNKIDWNIMLNGLPPDPESESMGPAFLTPEQRNQLRSFLAKDKAYAILNTQPLSIYYSYSDTAEFYRELVTLMEMHQANPNADLGATSDYQSIIKKGPSILMEIFNMHTKYFTGTRPSSCYQ